MNRILSCIVAIMISLLTALVVRAQTIEELGEKGGFLLRPQTTFQHYCAPCHGETARGDGRYFGFGLQPLPRDLTDAAYMNTKTDAELVASIVEGTASVGKSNLCPPWGKTLGRKRIEVLVQYLRTLSREPDVHDAAANSPPVTEPDPIETGKPLQVSALIAVCILLIGAGWVQWRNLQQHKGS